MDVVACGAAISACGKSGRWHEALVLFMDQLPKNVILYNSAISACEIQGRWVEALALLSKAYEDHVELTMISFNAAITACKTAGRWQEALHVFGNCMFCEQLSLISYNCLVPVCQEAAQWQHCVCQSFLIFAVCSGNLLRARMLLSAVLNSCETGHRFQEVSELISRLQGKFSLQCCSQNGPAFCWGTGMKPSCR